MKRRIRLVAAAIGLTVILGGCGVPSTWNDPNALLASCVLKIYYSGGRC